MLNAARVYKLDTKKEQTLHFCALDRTAAEPFVSFLALHVRYTHTIIIRARV